MTPGGGDNAAQKGGGGGGGRCVRCGRRRRRGRRAEMPLVVVLVLLLLLAAEGALRCLAAAAAAGAGAAASAPAVRDASKKQGAYGKVRVHREPALSQLLRLDEVLAAFVLARVRPLRSNAARASGAAAEDRDLEFCSDVLGRVSRSFAGVIGQLPPALLADVMVFYLVLRALDTVEDDTAIDAKAKITALEGFARRALLDPPGSWSPPDAGEGDEKLLLQEFDKVRRVYDRLPPASRKVIADVTDEMARGMASFAGRDFRQGTADLEEYDLYCHYVAGLVGEGLSRLFAASGLESDPILASPDQRLSDQMGLFLQKTNIIRDYLEDYVDGRAFWPQSVWRKHCGSGSGSGSGADDLGYFVLQHDPAVRRRSVGCLDELVADALAVVPDCLQYLSRLRCAEVFRFCAIPQVMAVATLEKCFANPDVFTGVVKIRRGLSCRLVLSHSGSLPEVHEAFHEFALRISRKAGRMLAKTDEDDPAAYGLRRTLEACRAICDATGPLAYRLRRIRALGRLRWALLLCALLTASALDRAAFGAAAALLWLAAAILSRRLLEGTPRRLVEARVLERQVARDYSPLLPAAA